MADESADENVLKIRIEMEGKYADAELDKALFDMVPEDTLSIYIAGALAPYIEALLLLGKG